MSIIRTKPTIIFLTFFTLVLAGCSGGSSEPPTSKEISGGGVKGPLANAVITVYDFDPTQIGFKGEIVDTATTDDSAANSGLTLPFPLAPPYIMEYTSVSGTTDITTGVAPVIGTLRTVITQSLLDTDEQIYATPLTTMAVDIAIANSTTISTATQFQTALAVAASQVVSTLGFGMTGNIDIFDVPPLIDNTTDTLKEQSDVSAYRSAIEALSAIVFIMKQQSSGASVEVVLTELSIDLADGEIDGVVNGETSTLFTSTTLDVLAQDPSTLIIPNTTQTVADVQSILIAETATTSSTTPTAPTTELDTGGSISTTIKSSETNPDVDGDGVLNADDAFPENSSETIDTDGDGIGNNTDHDDDNDGILDVDEGSTPTPTGTDSDGDGFDDGVDNCPANFNPAQTNTDTLADGGDACDTDDDDDGALDIVDLFPLNPSEQFDADKDGMGDNADTDDDNDGITDTIENNSGASVDHDSDGIPNREDIDSDNDNVFDSVDFEPYNNSVTFNNAPITFDNNVFVNEDVSVTILLEVNDDGVAAGPLAFTITAPSNGVLSGTEPNLTYAPNAEFSGSDSFTFLATDGDGEVSNVSTVNITVNSVNDSPVIDQTGPLAITMSEDGSPTAFIAPTITASDIDSATLTWTGSVSTNGIATVSGTGLSPIITYVPNTDFVGSDSFTVTVNDGDGSNKNITVNVTVIDTTPPVVTVPANITVEAVSAAGTSDSNSAIATFLLGSSAIDAVDPSPTFTSDNTPATFPLGVTVVTFTYTDSAGNVGIDTATVTVFDTTAPTVTVPANITVEATSAAGTLASNTAIKDLLASSSAVDAIDPSPVLSHDAPATFPLGITDVTFSYTDSANNVGTNKATVTVIDTTAPVVTAPLNLTVEAESSAGTPVSNTSIMTFLADSSAVDAVDPASAFSHDAPATFPLGITVVTFTHTDAAGNVGSNTSTLNVVDTTAPVITLVGSNPVTVDLNSTFLDLGSSVTDAVSTGLVATATGTVNTSIGGVHLLSYDVTDAAGNIATTITRTVNVEVAAPTNVSFTVSGKHLNFTWDASTALDHWRILENPDGASGFSVNASANNIAGNTTGFSLEIPVHLTDWVNAQYIVEACDVDETQCKASPNQTTTLIDSIAATFYFKASNTDDRDKFGYSVSISADGNTLAVGASGEESSATGVDGDQNDNSASNSGAVYVFTRSGTNWVQQAYLKASNINFDDLFGYSVSISADGNTLAVGGPWNDSDGVNGDQSNNNEPNSGAVYVFNRSVNSWSQQAYLKASHVAALTEFGTSVSISADGNTLAVGGGNVSRAAYVFSRNDSNWSQQAAFNVDEFVMFGWSVSISADGNTLAIGAPHEESSATGINGDQNNNDFPNAGAVFVFFRSENNWNQQAYLKASNTGPGDEFGWSVSISADGNTLAVGADRDGSSTTGIDGDQNNNDAASSGAVYVFTRNGANWVQQVYLKASNTDPDDLFGWSVSISADGNTLAVGANAEESLAQGVGGDQYDNSGIRVFEDSAGAVYVFSRSDTTWTQRNYVKASNTGILDSFGQVTISGDGNTLVVGAENESSADTGIGGIQTDDSASLAGAVYVY